MYFRVVILLTFDFFWNITMIFFFTEIKQEINFFKIYSNRFLH